jgi:CheY-like chemotaxis protein
VDDLLDVSRITRGKITLAHEPIAVATLVERAVETVQPLLEERHHELAVEMPNRACWVNGDPLRLMQALGNLLSNAARYTPNGGRIVVTVQSSANGVAIAVRDSGMGIPPERLAGIFDLFTQVNRGCEDPQSGLGIGLSLVRQLVEMHAGTVTADSAGVGLGSEFVIHLPESAAPGPTTGDAQQPETFPDGEVRRRVLIADDNADMLATLGAVLELSGHQVFRASNGQLALEAAARHLPEVALLDVGMPQLDGYEVARRIRAQPWGRGVTLIAVTGWGQEADRRRSREAGLDLHLVKPLDAERLQRLLTERTQDPPLPAG